VYVSHADWIIRTFWWGLLWLVISTVATWLFIGWLGLVATVIWIVWRLVKGWLALCEEQSPAHPL